MDYFTYIKEAYPHLRDKHIKILESRAKEILINLLYKNKLEVSDEQKKKAFKRYEMWILSCMEELISKSGMTNAISYSENGVSITFDSSGISQSLRNEIVPIIWGN